MNPRVVVGSIVDQLNVEGNAVSLTVTASEPGATLTFSATGLPTGLSINASTGVISGTVSTGAAAHGPYQTVVTVSDGTYSTATSFGWTIHHANNIAPVLTNPGMQANAVGDSVTMAMTASDANGDALTYGAQNLPYGLFIDSQTGVISGTIIEEALVETTYAVIVTTDDGNGGRATQTFSWIVNDSALTVQAASLTAIAGTTASNMTIATFTNSDPNWGWWNLYATINWGDGSAIDEGFIDGGNGSFTVSGSHVYARAGNYTTSVAIADGSQTITSAGTVAVSAAPIVVSGGFVQGAAAGIEVSATLASFTGNASALASTFTATINWGDTTSGVGTITGVNGKFVVAGKHTYPSTGTYTVNVTVTDLDASTGSANSTVQVGDVLAGIPATLTVATFRSNDPNATIGQFTATINWGDTASSSGTITAMAGGIYNVQGTHKYAADGAYTVTTTVYGPYNESITTSRTATAKAPALTGYAENVAAKPGVAFSNVAVAEVIDPNQSDTSGMFSALINWGDGTSSVGTVSGANGVFEVKGGHTYATAGNYAIGVLVNLRDTARSLASAISNGLVAAVDDKKDVISAPPWPVIRTPVNLDDKKIAELGLPETSVKWIRSQPSKTYEAKPIAKINSEVRSYRAVEVPIAVTEALRTALNSEAAASPFIITLRSDKKINLQEKLAAITKKVGELAAAEKLKDPKVKFKLGDVLGWLKEAATAEGVEMLPTMMLMPKEVTDVLGDWRIAAGVGKNAKGEFGFKVGAEIKSGKAFISVGANYYRGDGPGVGGVIGFHY